MIDVNRPVSGVYKVRSFCFARRTFSPYPKPLALQGSACLLLTFSIIRTQISGVVVVTDSSDIQPGCHVYRHGFRIVVSHLFVLCNERKVDFPRLHGSP